MGYFSCRYYNVLAYDHSRVIVHHDDKEIYINANVVKVAKADRKYILAQGESALGGGIIRLWFIPGPLEKTVDDFWLMIYQQNSSMVVMLCNCVEMNRDKSWPYWPSEVGGTFCVR